MTERFEDLVEHVLHDVDQPDDAALESLRQFAANLPDRERTRRRRFAVTAFVTVAILIMALAVGRDSLLGLLGPGQPHGGSAGYPIDSADPRFSECYGDTQPVLAAFSMSSGVGFAAHFPNARLSLPDAGQPTFVVVFQDTWQGPIQPQLGFHPPSTIMPANGQERDLCVWLGAPVSGEAYVFTGVDISGMVP